MAAAAGSAARKVMIRDQDLDPGLAGTSTPDSLAMPSSTVTMRSGPGQGRLHHRRAQTIAEGEAARHQVGDPRSPQGLEAAHRQALPVAPSAS